MQAKRNTGQGIRDLNLQVHQHPEDIARDCTRSTQEIKAKEVMNK